MTTYTDILEVNWVVLYFVYGQAFIILGIVTGLRWQRRSRLELARPLPWLAAFGLAHGLNEWGYIFIPLQATYLPDSVVRVMVLAHLLLLAVSFLFLFQFGVELLLPLFPWHRWLRVVPVGTLILWSSAIFVRSVLSQDRLNVLVAIGDSWSRYLLCFPGAILAHLGLLRQTRQVREMGFSRIAAYLTGAAVAFSVYALFGGLIVPTAPLFPANLLNYELLMRTIHVPVPVFRSLCGVAMAIFIARSLDVFRVEAEHLIEEIERDHLLTADRERIGRELHDGIIQNIYAAGLSLEHTQHVVAESPDQAQRQIRSVMDTLNRTIQDIRSYIFDLRVAEETHELEAVLENLVHDLRLDTLLDVELEVVGAPCCAPNTQLTAHLTQIAREALSNVVQHAQARRVLVSLQYEGDQIRLSVADDGRGMQVGEVDGDGQTGHGIANMRARARLMGGDLSLASGPGRGTRAEVTVPCGAEEGYDG
ncbi:MAG: sensor histidine kinase [Anaerolineae bacterium]|nr:MAG: sensor histidine kinase [Anaerolineae bacterium]